MYCSYTGLSFLNHFRKFRNIPSVRTEGNNRHLKFLLQVLIDRLLEECRNVRTLVVKSRPSQKIHPDVDRLEEDVRKLRMRWENICSQIIERLVLSACLGFVLHPPHYVGRK